MIPEYQKILYATDLTEHAATVFRHAVALARSNKSEIYVLHVLPETKVVVEMHLRLLMGEEKLAKLELEYDGEVAEKIRLLIDGFIQTEWAASAQDIDLVTEVEVCHGEPKTEIIAASKRHNVDLIVMGAHGKGSLKHALLGGVTEKVLHKSSCPVVVVPMPS